LLMLTGARRNEVASMQWAELVLENKLWTLPASRTKNKRPHELPLSDASVKILESLPRKGNFVFSTTGRSPISGFSKIKSRLDKVISHSHETLPAWHLHDLRRSFASGLARLGVELHVIERCLNHVSGTFGGIVEVYQRHKFEDEKRRAFD